MTPDAFETLCHRACLALGLADPHALGKGHTVTLDAVHLEVQHVPPQAHFRLLAEIARFPEGIHGDATVSTSGASLQPTGGAVHPTDVGGVGHLDTPHPRS